MEAAESNRKQQQDSIPQATDGPTRRRRRRRRKRKHRSSSPSRGHRTIRAFYFAVASSWGFVAGSAAVLIALNALGRPVPLAGALVTALITAAALAVVGGIVVSAAYRDASRRR